MKKKDTLLKRDYNKLCLENIFLGQDYLQQQKMYYNNYINIM